ncbi:hypothetical protein [uncultured Desulfovibrio sp.]|nr:hypothetical protein [uncultured Desulfovibrio sp.]
MSGYIVGIAAGLFGLTACGVALVQELRAWARLRRMAADVAAREGR